MRFTSILLDVCGTLVDFQTANHYVRYVLQSTDKRRYFISDSYKLFYRIFGGSEGGMKYKNANLMLLKSMSKESLEQHARSYAKDYLLSNLNHAVLGFIQEARNKNSGVKLIIVSGGYDVYLTYIKSYLAANHLVCTELEYENDIFTGHIKGYDCLDAFKILKLHEDGLLRDIDFETTAVLSDSHSDMPLFKLGKYKITVNPDQKLKPFLGKGWLGILNWQDNLKLT